MRFLLLIGVVACCVTNFINAMFLAQIEKEESIRAVTRSINTFSANFFKTVAAGNEKNLICSPVSVSTVLSMAYYGARGNTKDQLHKGLALPENDALTKQGFTSLLGGLTKYTQVELRMANKIFLAEHIQPKPEFTEVTKNSFLSEVQRLDFGQSVLASNTINDWCMEQTNGRIKDLFTPDNLGSNTALVLVNAVYFNGNWASRFPIEATRDRPFHVNANKTINVPTMYQSGSFRHGELDALDATFLELPYKSVGSQDAVSMFIILPNTIDGLAKVIEGIDTVSMDTLMRGDRRDCEIFLPKFKIESQLMLEHILKKMNMTDMFVDGVSDFTGIVDAPPLTVTKVVQKAFIEVNEKGSEAAAATAVVAMATSAFVRPPPTIYFSVDRPFLCIIGTTQRRDRNGSRLPDYNTSTGLFGARVVDPSIAV